MTIFEGLVEKARKAYDEKIRALEELLKSMDGVDTRLGSLLNLDKHDWTLYFEKEDGIEEVSLLGVLRVLLHHPKFGTWFYGQAPGGKPWDQWSFRENGGGGAVTIPWTVIDGKFYVGMLRQPRPLQSDEVVWNIPRGFIQGGDHGETAKAEFKEETGVVTEMEMKLLKGDGVNPNSAFFETWVKGEGVRFYSVRFPVSLLEKAEDGSYQLKEKVQPLDKKENFLSGLIFRRVDEISLAGDMFTLAGLGRLMSQYMDLDIKE